MNICERGPNFKLFLRVLPYFRGKIHMEEIMWRETVTRDEMLIVIEEYKSILVVVKY